MGADSLSSISSEQKVAEPAVPRVRWRRIVRRVLKYGFLASLLCAICLVVVVWVRSATWNDRVDFGLSQDCVILLKSKQSEVTIGVFKTTTVFGTATSRTGRYRFFTDLARAIYPPDRKGFRSLDEEIEQKKSLIGVGLVSEIKMFAVHHAPMNYSTFPIRLPVGTYSGHGIIVPHWLLLLVFGSIFTLIVLGRRFTLRAFLIWVTIVCVILAIAVRTSGESTTAAQGSVQYGI